MIRAAIAIAVWPAPLAWHITCVVDVGTVWIEREKIRLLDIDAREMKGDCAAESAQGIRARDRLVVLRRGRELLIERNGTDRYGRTLARLGGVRDELVREGLVRRWGDWRGWCGND